MFRADYVQFAPKFRVSVWFAGHASSAKPSIELEFADLKSADDAAGQIATSPLVSQIVETRVLVRKPEAAV